MSDKSLIDNFLSEMDNKEQSQKDFEAELDGLNDEEIFEMLKKANPYSANIPNTTGKSERNASFSYTNMRMDFMKELVTTGMIGYLFQRCMIYEVPEEVRPISIAEYLKGGDAVCQPPSFVTDNVLKEKYRMMHETMKERVIVYKFLKDVFQYNPDKHVRSSWYPVKDDENRELIGTNAARVALATKNTVRKINKDQDHNPEMSDLPDAAKTAELGQTDNPVYEVIPPADHYEAFKNYFEDNYDDMVKAVYNITGSRPDIDMAINVYDTHNTTAEAEKFRNDHIDEVIAGIYNVPTNAWSVLAPYAANKEKEDFFNRETMHLKGMLDSREEKEKLAKDMLKKRIHKKKVANVRANGPDSDKFKAWAKQNTTNADSFGKEYKELDPAIDDGWAVATEDTVAASVTDESRAAERARVADMHPETIHVNPTEGMTQAEEEAYQKSLISQDGLARTGLKTSGDDRRKVLLDDDDECPDDAVEVGVFKISNGGLNVHMDKIYTESEAPNANLMGSGPSSAAADAPVAATPAE
jgi:hypothetical protein